MQGRMAAIAVLGLAASSSGQAQQAPQRPAESRTVQQDFEAATALSSGTDRAAALAAWEALEKRVADRPRNLGLVLVRKSVVLDAMNRSDESVAAARRGLALLPATDASLRDDRYSAYTNLAHVAHRTLDYASAASFYAQAETQATNPTDKLAALLGQIQTATFTDPAAAAAAATRADALLAQVKADKEVLASFASAKAVLALNRHDLPTATAQAMDAVKDLGGLTNKTDLRDAAARSTAALALLLSGRKDEARRYMAMTGAGRVPAGNFDPGAAMMPPDCGGEAGLKPQDMAVVQFSIRDDGTVLLAEPIYAEGGGAVALAFAQAARSWSWSVEQVKAIPSFLRYNVRVELRCNLAFPRPSIGDGLMTTLTEWLRAQGQPVPDEPENPAQALAGERAALAAARDGLPRLVALVALIRSPVVPREEKQAFAEEALKIAQGAKAPVTGQLGLALEERTNSRADMWGASAYRRVVAPLLDQAPYAANPQARAAIRLLLADKEEPRSDRRAALLDQVVKDQALGEHDALRTGALIRLASLAQARGDAVAAKDAFAQSGLSANQCALVGDAPQLRHAGGTFPEEAMSWGFEGWTRTQFDIAADGAVVAPRVIVSYPPFIFTQAGNATAKSFVFSKTYRPAGALACGAATRQVRFRLPSRH
ncbi:hypothetical protein [Sphingomonas melonis]